MEQPHTPETPPAGLEEARYNEFVALLARNDQAIRRFVRSLLPTREGVDDVMQETALECWKKFSAFQAEDPTEVSGSFVRWACVIARFKVLSWQRDRARDRLVFRESVVASLAASAMENLDRQEAERVAIGRCLAKLDADQRRLVLSAHFPGESVARIAAETGQRARRLYTRVNQIRKRLLACVQQRLAEEV